MLLPHRGCEVARQQWRARAKLGGADGRQDFEETIADEIAFCSELQDLSIDWRELKIDVFGDVAVATSLPVYTMIGQDGETTELEMLSTMVWVRTVDGWKIAHSTTVQ